jgi:prevent-host-death family protein
MKTIAASEAETHFAAVLDEVEKGETVIVTRDGRPVARVSPEGRQMNDAAAAMAEIYQFRREFRPTLDGISIRELIEEGRE